MSALLVAVPVLPLLAALAVSAGSITPRPAARIATGASALAFAAALITLIRVGIDGPLGFVATGDDGRAIIGLSADRVGAVLITLTTAVAVVVQSFASRSLLGDPRARRFHLLALVLTSATSVVAVSATATGLVAAWLVTSVVMVALVGHRAPWPPAVAATRRTRWSFAIGDAVLVVAVLVALAAIGNIDMRNVAADAAALDGEQIAGVNALTSVAVLLVVAGVARSALIPIHRWLPTTLAAPTPVSALLHAGVVNGAGVLLIRFSPIFGSSVGAMSLAFVLGVLTALVATAVMLVRTDVKGALVWSTSGQMGFMVLQLGVGAFAAALFHIVGHALYKATMFLGAGGAISAHSRQVRRPHLGRADTPTLTSPPVRIGVGIVAPLAAFAAALTIIDPHVTTAGMILIVVFGTFSIGRAAIGWMASTPFSTSTTVLSAVAGVATGVFGYVGGITIFELFVVDVVPYDVPAAVGPMWVTGVLIGIGALVAAVAFAPGERGAALRRRVYVSLLSTGATTATVESGGPALAAPTEHVAPRTEPSLVTAGEHS